MTQIRPKAIGNPATAELSRRALLAGATAAGAGVLLSQAHASAALALSPSPEEFYSESHYGNYWQMTGPYYDPSHRGQDFNGWAAGTQIPAYRQGQVVFNQWVTDLGWCVGLRFSDGKYGGFAHLSAQSPRAVGTTVPYGGSVGSLGNTGVGTGPHVHCTVHNTSGNPYQGSTQDPLEYIKQSLGVDMPTLANFSVDQSGPTGTPITLNQITPAEFANQLAPWVVLPRSATNPAVTNLAELAPGHSSFDINFWFYSSNLPAGEVIAVRAAVQAMSNNSVSAQATEFVGDSAFAGSGGTRLVRGRYTTKLKLPASSRILLQAAASVPGVTLTNWGAEIHAW